MNGEISSFLIDIKEIDLRFFKITPSKTIFPNLNIEEVSSLINVSPKQVLWKINNQSYGEYCRSMKSKFDQLSMEFYNSYGDHRKQLFDQLIREIEFIKENEGQNREIIFSKIAQLTIPNFKDSILDPLFEFRMNSLDKFISRIKEEFTRNQVGLKNQIYFKKADELRIFSSVGFCWNRNRNLIKDSTILHSYLCSNEFIDKDTSVADFKLAFDCTFIDSVSPLRIHWIKKVKGKDSKGLIFHFVDQLEHLNLISITLQNLALFNKIGLIFCDSNGNSFCNLSVSKSQWLNQRKSEYTPQELELDSILFKLFYLK